MLIIINSLTDALFLQSLLISIHDWCVTLQLALNSDKWQVLHLGHSNLRFIYGFSEFPRPSPRLVADLGLRMDDSLSFSSHISAIASKARARCGVYFKTFISRDPQTMLKFYVTFVRPILEYCSVAWSPTAVRDINIIFINIIVQRYFSNIGSLHWEPSAQAIYF